jgi:signal transduction histidine kinase
VTRLSRRPPGDTASAGRPRRAPAIRVAAVATLIIAVIYVAALAIFNVLAARQLVSQVDTQLRRTLKEAQSSVPFASAVSPRGVKNIGGAPVYLWEFNAAGRQVNASSDAPPLPPGSWSTSPRPRTRRIGTETFRLRSEPDGADWLVAGQNLYDVQHIHSVLITGELVASPVLLAAVFLGTLVIGLQASGPVEQARRHQLEFAADASHELRTPLSVIEAEAGLALSTHRDAGQYKTALQRIGRESQRLRSIVNDLLWLARFDSEPANPGDEPVDVLTIAEVCADRFSAVARSRGIDLLVRSEGEPQALITAPPEWIDRLAGVLVDNAIRYATVPGAPGGPLPTVRIVVASAGSRVSLSVEDNGPGIPQEKRARLFDRFYRATAEGGGSGLGLAIADAVVRSTGGRWRVDDSPLGGARLQVTWHGPGARRPRRRWRLSTRRAGQLT